MSVITGCTESRPATGYSCMTPLRLLTVRMVRGCPWFTLLSSLAAVRPVPSEMTALLAGVGAGILVSVYILTVCAV